MLRLNGYKKDTKT